MYPILFEIGPIRIATYGLMLAIGFLLGLAYLKRELARKALNVEIADRIMIAAMVGGIVGGKIFHLFEFSDQFFNDPFGMIFSGSGLAWYGGLIGGTGAVLWILRRHNCLDFSYIDAISPSLVIGYFFGRGGCQLSGDGCYGVQTSLPWGMAYPRGIVPTDLLVHPTPVYEMLQMVAIFVILWGFRSRLRTPGHLFSLYLITIGLARFSVEFVRRTPQIALDLTVHQWISLSLILVGAFLLYRLKHQFTRSAR